MKRARESPREPPADTGPMYDASHSDDGRIAADDGYIADDGRTAATRSAPDEGTQREPRPTAADDQILVSRVERYDDAPDQCTIHPDDAEEPALLTTWISADADSYVSLAAMR